GERVEIDDARGQLAIFGGARRGVLVLAFARERVVEGPVFYVALAALHHGAAHAGIPGFAIGGDIGFREMELRIGHAQLFADTRETHLAIGLFEAERVRDGRLLAGLGIVPFVHAPEVCGVELEAELVDQSRDERELFRRADRAAEADRIIGRAFLPGGDV